MILEFEEKIAEYLKNKMKEDDFNWYLSGKQMAYQKLLNFLAQIISIINASHFTKDDKLTMIENELKKVQYEFTKEYLVEEGGYMGTGDAWKTFYVVKTARPLNEWVEPRRGSRIENDYIRVYITLDGGEEFIQVAFANWRGFWRTFLVLDKEKSKDLAKEYFKCKNAYNI